MGKTNRIPNGILCADMHLREQTPICYMGDYEEDQWETLDYISDIQKTYNCFVLHAGDLFDKWKPSPYLLRKAILHIPNKFYTIYGQHDLPEHSLDLVDKCGINVLEAAGKLKVLSNCHWGQIPDPLKPSFHVVVNRQDRKVLVWHNLTYKHKPFPTAVGGLAAGVLRKHTRYDLILTGDNHQAFTEEHEGRLLVNPGSMMRMHADQIDFHPRVYLWYAEDNTVEPVYLPFKDNVISQEHIIAKKQRDGRIDAFISRLDEDWKVGMSFEDNLEEFFKTNDTKESVKRIIYKAIS